MSEPKRWELWEVIMEDTNSEWVRFEDYAHLKAEVERLHKYVETMERESMSDEYDINHQTRIINGLLTDKERLKADAQVILKHLDEASADCARLKAEVERLRKAGDNLARAADENGCHDNGDAKDLDDSIDRWYAAKDGKPSV